MQKQGKSRKPLIVGIIAAVVILAVLLVLLLTQCTGGQGDKSSTPTTDPSNVASDYQLYWNMDKAEYAGKSEAGLSSRMPAEDGFFYVRFFYEGEVVTYKVADRRTINSIDVQDLMGLEFDDEGVVVGVKKLDDLPVKKDGWQFFVQSAAKTVIKLNSSENLNGMEIMLEDIDPNRVWDMTGKSGEPGSVDTPIPLDKVMPVQNLEGQTTHVFIYERTNYMQTHKAYCQHCNKEVEWTEWDKEDQIPAVSGHYQLQNDIVLSTSTAQLPEETQLCLDLNGHRIDGKKNTRIYAMRQAAASFALMDTSEAQTGVIASHGKTDQGGVVWPTKGAFYMYGGTLDASDAYTNKSAPAVSVSSGAYFYMYGGKIIGGTAKPIRDEKTGKYSGGYAGAVAVMGKFVMHDGIIENGRAKAVVTYKDGKPTYNQGRAGNIYVSNGVFEMHGGVIRGGKSDGTGGNIRVNGNSAEFIMNGGSIQGGICYGKGQNGGNINIASSGAKFIMNGGSIVGGVSYNGGGNVYCAGDFTMNSGYIGGGALMKFGENKRATGSSYNMMFVNGKFTQWGGTVLGGVSIQDTSADGKFQTVLNLYHKAKIHGGEDGKNLTISKNGDGVIVNVGALKYGADICVNASGIFTKPTKEANLKYFHSDVEGVDVIYYQECLAMGKASCICGASKTTDPDTHDVGCDGTVLFWGPWTEKNNVPLTTGNYFLVSDVTTTGQKTINAGNQDVKLDLNGHNITLKASPTITDGFRLYRADKTNKLAITDTTVKMGGTAGTLKTIMPTEADYVEGSAKTLDEMKAIWKRGNFGMILWPSGGEISVHNGTYDASNLDVEQPGVLCRISSNGTLNIYGGTIIGGKTTGTGNILVAGGSTLNVYGGVIKDGQAATGANIYSSGGKVNLYGGNIDGGIYGVGSAVVKLSGAPVVGDKDGGLYTENPIAIDGTLKTGASVYTSKTGFITDETVEANKEFLHSTIADLEINYMENKLFAGKMSCLCNYGKTVGGKKVTAHSAGCIEAMTELGLDVTKDLLEMSAVTAENYSTIGAGGNWYLSSDLTIGEADKQDAPAVYIADGSKLILDLNGKTLTINRPGMAFTTQNAKTNGAWLIITDTSANQSGKIEVIGSGTNQGGIVRLWGSGAKDTRFYLLAGALDASQYMLGTESKQAYGGAVEVHHKQDMYMYGGTIIGSQSPYISNGSAVRVNSGYMYMYGGTIYGGKNADVSVVQNSNVFEMYGGTVCGGVATATDKVKITGSAVINKALAPAGITVPSYSLSVATDKTVDFAGLTGEVYVTAGGKFGINANTTIATLVKADNANGKVELDGTDLVMGYADLTYCECGGTLNNKYGHVCNKVVWKAWTSTDSLPTDGNWYLTGDVNLSADATLPANVTVRLDLMGKKVTLASDIRMYKFTGNGKSTLVITDTEGGEGVVANGTCSSNGGIMDIKDKNTVKIYNVILNASARTLAENGGIAAVRAGSQLTTYNVTMMGGFANKGTNGSNKSAGAFRMFNDGGLHVYGGTISGGKAAGNGGVLYANGSNVMHFEDVTLEGGESAGNGGVFCLSGTTQLTLKNCVITGAKAAGYGGAIYLSGSSAQVTISGTTTITANTTADGLNASNIYVNAGKLIIANDFTGKIGLAGKAGTGLTDSVTALDHKFITGKNIVLDDAANYRFKIYDNKLGMEEIPPEPRMQCVCGGVLKGTEGHTCTVVEFQPWTSTSSLPTAAGNYYLNKNVGLSATATIGANVNIDLNGKTVSNAGGIALNVTAGTVTVTDSTATAGTISGGAGGVIKTSGTAVLNLYAGTVTGGKSDSGAVQLNGTSKLNLAGKVQITANTTADGSAASNVNANGGTMAFLPGFAGKVGVAGTYGKLVATGITSESDALLTGGKIALDDKSGDFKLVAGTEGLTYGLANQNLKYACVCGGTLNGKYGHTCEMIFWEPWDKTDSLPTEAGNYYLKNTVTLKSTGTVAKNATVRLDLNGKTVTLSQNYNMYKFTGNAESTLVITDTVGGGNVVANGSYANNGGVMDISAGNAVEIYNVTLDCSNRVLAENGTVASVRAEASLTTYNVTMKGGTAGTWNGTDGVKKDGGVFRLFGDSNGVTEGGRLTVYGGTIYGGTATSRASVLYANTNNVISFTDVSIIGGTAPTGGFYISGTTSLTLKDTTIDGCTSTNGYSGAIYAGGSNVVELDGVTIKNCTSTSNGGAILMNNKDAQLIIKGNTVITENKKGTTVSNIAANYAKKVTIDPSFNGTVSFATKAGLALISGVTDLNDPRLGVNILLDDPATYEFALFEDGGVTYLGFKAK